MDNQKEIFRNTAFIQRVFKNKVEINKFVGEKIQTVSWIRGQIKKQLVNPSWAFITTFERKLVESDIVFLKGLMELQKQVLQSNVKYLRRW